MIGSGPVRPYDLEIPVRRGLHPLQHRRGIESEPDDADQERYHNGKLPAGEVGELLVLRIVEAVEDEPLEGPQEIRRREDDPRRRYHRGVREGTKAAQQDEKLPDEAVESRKSD